jgi:uncharacterized DUF497 family protein
VYRDDHFEWDENKDRANQAKHGLGFREVLGAFLDPHGLDALDARHAEERWVLIARIPMTDLVVTISYTERGDRDRLISARTATRAEARTYHAHGG